MPMRRCKQCKRRKNEVRGKRHFCDLCIEKRQCKGEDRKMSKWLTLCDLLHSQAMDGHVSFREYWRQHCSHLKQDSASKKWTILKRWLRDMGFFLVLVDREGWKYEVRCP